MEGALPGPALSAPTLRTSFMPEIVYAFSSAHDHGARALKNPYLASTHQAPRYNNLETGRLYLRPCCGSPLVVLARNEARRPSSGTLKAKRQQEDYDRLRPPASSSCA
ncbi:hypothetical protein HPB50_013327 [Hyalomma asiaticum]|uniref:Uncharacterized protein n=1 Tax=Hyalomma asiaticum TaxID=266040 RepID=A0ACB7TGY5_HYAAI|nr:hypothetical protein HPB50_013327 [Hyalomma asiaticum]